MKENPFVESERKQFAAPKPPAGGRAPIDFEKRPDVVLSLLEDDQLVMAKQQTRFGLRRFSPALRALLWALRIYVIIMLVLVAVSIFRAIQLAH